jgi:hypothetical protein
VHASSSRHGRGAGETTGYWLLAIQSIQWLRRSRTWDQGNSGGLLRDAARHGRNRDDQKHALAHGHAHDARPSSTLPIGELQHLPQMRRTRRTSSVALNHPCAPQPLISPGSAANHSGPCSWLVTSSRLFGRIEYCPVDNTRSRRGVVSPRQDDLSARGGDSCVFVAPISPSRSSKRIYRYDATWRGTCDVDDVQCYGTVACVVIKRRD